MTAQDVLRALTVFFFLAQAIVMGYRLPADFKRSRKMGIVSTLLIIGLVTCAVVQFIWLTQ